MKTQLIFLTLFLTINLLYSQSAPSLKDTVASTSVDTAIVDSVQTDSDTVQVKNALIKPMKPESKFSLPNLRAEEPPSKSSLLSDKTISMPIKEKTFFDEYESQIPDIQAQIDSLKTLMKLYKKDQKIPTIREELLDLIQVPERLHRITLQNGTVIIGEIIEEMNDKIILKTNIGKLVLNQDSILKIDEEFPPSAKIEFIEDPLVNSIDGKEIVTGTVINTGGKRGDFVRIIANLWTETTGLAAQDSAFINGSEFTFNSGVRSDTALEPEQNASFQIEVNLPRTTKIQYRTFDIRWED